VIAEARGGNGYDRGFVRPTRRSSPARFRTLIELVCAITTTRPRRGVILVWMCITTTCGTPHHEPDVSAA
jgi:hypothetical protein